MKDIYCPLCKAKGKKKLLGRCDEHAEGKIYLWCKWHGEVEIELRRAGEPMEVKG